MVSSAPEMSHKESSSPTDPEFQQQALAIALVRTKPWLTWGIAAFLGVLFLLELFWGEGDPSVPLGRMGSLDPSSVRHGELWLLLTHAFLHLNVAHVVFNGVALMTLGPFLEVLLGPKRFFVAFVASAVAGGAVVALFDSRGAVGASGGIWGLMTLTALLILRPNAIVPRGTARTARPRMLRALIINAAISFLPGISLAGHLGGGIGGALLGLGLPRGVVPVWKGENGLPRVAWLEVTFWGCAALVIVSIAAAFATGKPWELLSAPTLERVPAGTSGITLLVPREMRHRSEEQSSEGRSYVFGDVKRDGLLVVLTIGRAPRETTVESVYAALLAARPIEGYVLEIPARIAKTPRPHVFLRAKSDGGPRYTQFVTIDRENRIELIVLNVHTTRAWSGLESKLFEGIEIRN